MTKLSSKNVAQAIYASVKNKSGTDLEHALTKAVEFLAKKNLLSKAPEILAQLQEVGDADQNIVNAKVTSKTKLPDQTKEKIQQALKNRYKAKEVRLESVEDESLIGGVRIEAKNEIIDSSLKNKLHQLQTYLLST